MNSMQKMVGSTALALALAAGMTAPTLAQKLDNKNPPATTSTTANTTSGIDFGNDSSQWANDGECDDPRFSGAGSATELADEDRGKDATDCRTALEAGTVTFNESTANPGADPTDIAIASPIDAIDFGDDSSDWAKDGECDDPRFSGTGSADELLDADIRKDATDCRAAYAAGTVTLKQAGTSPTDIAIASPIDAINFGDDSSEWAKDGECDDPRFAGTASADELLDADILKDATDCRAAYAAGTVTLADSEINTTPAAIDYGDDSSEWAKDDECDDPRFSGTGVADELLDSDIGHDATDCRAAVAAGTATFNGGAATTPVAAFDYGGDWSKWANDGECDDLRFQGEGTNKKLLSEDLYGDATDCQALEAEGKVTIRTVYTPDYAAGAPYDAKGIDFGDNTSGYADDEQCDDPRFEGPGAASTLLESDLLHDSADCKAAFIDGTVILRDGV